MSDLELESTATDIEIPEQCLDCPLAKSLSGQALELLLKNCEGIQIVRMGCDEARLCGSPNKNDA